MTTSPPGVCIVFAACGSMTCTGSGLCSSHYCHPYLCDNLVYGFLLVLSLFLISYGLCGIVWFRCVVVSVHRLPASIHIFAAVCRLYCSELLLYRLVGPYFSHKVLSRIVSLPADCNWLSWLSLVTSTVSETARS
ncbi:hypothetical protein BV25DRAFT_684493 [Artomyces pyxidatus]|uniref:Uncharacterized protein n=1 Tax=Artomyces pyxidatus TaxID=48021 RepID=A0ACB8SE82_9AGAM|nr:hypothetical protein BV25DRAFT_684493 [Artomyces pyxidatus]